MRRFEVRSLIIFIAAISLLLWIGQSATAEVVTSPEGVCVYDNDLGISWTQNANLAGENMTWPDALRWVSELIYAGFDDWRLPSIKELEHINKVEGISPFDPGPFENLIGDDYWSNAAYPWGSTYAWSYTFTWKHPHWGWIGYKSYVWPVRNGSCQ